MTDTFHCAPVPLVCNSVHDGFIALLLLQIIMVVGVTAKEYIGCILCCRMIFLPVTFRGAQIAGDCTMASNICGSSAWNLLRVTLLPPRSLNWLLDFWKICGPLAYKQHRDILKSVLITCVLCRKVRFIGFVSMGEFVYPRTQTTETRSV
jgi:hypothetical protein